MSKSIYEKIIPKTVKNTVKEQLNKNKPKLIQKVSSYALDKAIGSPYMDIVIGVGKTIKNKFITCKMYCDFMLIFLCIHANVSYNDDVIKN